MSPSSKLSIILVMFMLIPISSVLALNGQQAKSDDMCKITRDVLCVKDVLMIIATVARRINRTTNEIENHILNKIQADQLQTLNRYVDFEKNLIRSHLPTPLYHAKFIQVNNIDKVFHCFIPIFE
jgi:hypothetical protein